MITAPPSRAWAPAVPAARATDEELMLRVREGDERAFDEVYARYRVPLHRYCHSIVRQREDAEEAYQSTMLAAFQTLSDPEAPVVSLRPWLYRIAHNACVSVLRRRPADPHAQLTGLELAPGGVVERSEVAADLRQLRRDLEQLSERQRAALVMRELGGLGHEEIGRAIGEDAAIVKQLIYNARLALHDLSAGRDMSCDRVRRTLSDGDRRVVRARGLRAHVRACASCASWEQALRARPGRLAALAPGLPFVALHELLGAAFGSAAATGVGALGAAAGGGGLVAASGGAVAAGVAAGAGTGAGAGLMAQVAILASTALVGGTAVVPALNAPATGPNRGGVVPPIVAAPTGPAPVTTPATPIGGDLGAPVQGTARADLGPRRDDAGAPDAAAPAWAGGDDQGQDGETAEAVREDDEVQELATDPGPAHDMERDEGEGEGAGQGAPATPPAGEPAENTPSGGANPNAGAGGNGDANGSGEGNTRGAAEDDQGGGAAPEAPAGPQAPNANADARANGPQNVGESAAKPDGDQDPAAEDEAATIAEDGTPPGQPTTGAANGNGTASENVTANAGIAGGGATAGQQGTIAGKGHGTAPAA